MVARRGTGSDSGSVVADGAQSGLQSALRLQAGLLRTPAKDIVEVRAALEQAIAYIEAGDAAGAGSALSSHVRRFYQRVMEP